MIKQAIIEKLKVATSLNSVFLLHAPPKTEYPYVILNRISAGPLNATMTGPSPDWSETFQVDVYSDDDGEAEKIRNAIIRAMHVRGWQQWGNVIVYLSRITGAQDNSHLEADGEQVSFARQTIDVQIKYKMEK